MFCANCGNQLPDQAKFCAKCGQPVAPKERPAESGNRRPQGEPAGTTDTKQTASRTAGTSAAQSNASVSGEAGLYNPDAWKKYAHGEAPNALTARYTNRREEAGLYNPDAWKNYDPAAGQNGARTLRSGRRNQLHKNIVAGRVFVSIAFILLALSFALPVLSFGVDRYGTYAFYQAAGMFDTWYIFKADLSMSYETFNAFLWISVGIIGMIVIIPVFCIRRDSEGNSWIVAGCVLCWFLLIFWCVCAAQVCDLIGVQCSIGFFTFIIGTILDTIGVYFYF